MAGLNTGSLRISGRTSGFAGAPLEAKMPKHHPERQDARVSSDTQQEKSERGIWLIHPRDKVAAILEENYGVYDETEDEDAAGIRRGIFRFFRRTHGHR
jgi:hypothetical protein